MLTNCSIHTLIFLLPLFLASCLSPLSILSSPHFLLTFSLFLLITRVTFSLYIYPRTLLIPTRRERERERRNQTLGPWRNQFKWLSVDVIDFHFTRLSRGRRSSTRCVTSTSHPRAVVACPASARFSLPRPFSLFLYRFASSASISSSLSLSASISASSFFLRQPQHACDAYVRNIERIKYAL